MDIITFFVIYYHVFFVCSSVIISIDYIIGSNLFRDIRNFLDAPVTMVYIFIEFMMILAAGIAYSIGSTAIFSALWIITVLMIVSVIISVLMFIAHRILDIEW